MMSHDTKMIILKPSLSLLVHLNFFFLKDIFKLFLFNYCKIFHSHHFLSCVYQSLAVFLITTNQLKEQYYEDSF